MIVSVKDELIQVFFFFFQWQDQITMDIRYL